MNKIKFIANEKTISILLENDRKRGIESKVVNGRIVIKEKEI